MQISELKRNFEEVYGSGGQIRFFFSPGRANLIGEHIDYNGGHALPFALKQGLYCAVRLRKDRSVQMCAIDIEPNRVRGFRLDAVPSISSIKGWMQIPLSIMAVVQERGCHLHSGMDVLYVGDLPREGDLAIISAMGVVTTVMLSDLFDLKDRGRRADAAVICQEAERLRSGADSGIMGPLSCILGREDHAIFLSAPKLQYEYLPLKLQNACLILTNTMVQYAEAMEVYPTRKLECEKALKKLKVVANIDRLCDLSLDTFNNCKDVIMNETYTKRARHAVTENARTIRAVNALRIGNLKRLGELMYQSHDSLRDDYEVSCQELDFLVEQARSIPGVLGSRMMGGGFGGSTITLLECSAADRFMEQISESYHGRFGIFPEFYYAQAGDGARELFSVNEVP